ncbi:hypothetical protein EP7_002643 [Isosphaeraceae bacterium EP7]
MSVGRLICVVFLFAIAFALWREPVGRVFVIVFGVGLVEAWLGVFALMALFESLLALIEAGDPPERLTALAESTVILIGSATIMALLAVIAGALAWRFAI